MRNRSSRRLGFVVAGILGVAIGVAPPHAAGVTVTADRLLVDSVDDYVGGDVRTELTDADASFGFVSGALYPGEIRIVLGNSATSWTVSFVPPAGETLQVGHYPDAGVQTPITPDLRITTNSNGCGASRIGSFTIQQLDRDGAGNPVAIAATFEQWCDSSFGPLVGLVRVNSVLPQALLSSPQTDRSFGSVTTGESSGTRTFTLESLGELPVDVDSVAITGAAALEYPLTANGCNGATLDTGETCSFAVTFEPTVTGDRPARIVIANDAPQGARVLALGGVGRIPTTTAVQVQPDTVYFVPGIKLIATVAPAPGHNAVECWYDGELLGTSIVNPGSAFCVHPRELGTHVFLARYEGSHTYGDSESTELSFVVSSSTEVDLVASKSTVPAGVPVTFTVEVSTASDLLYPGGSVVLRDLTTNQVLATRAIAWGSATHVLSASFAAGTHQVQARYEGVDGILDESSDSVSLTVLADTTAPTATAPRHVPAAGSALSPSGGLPVRLTWTGSDNLSGIARYQVSRQTDGGAWSSPSIVTGPSLTVALAPYHDYRYRIRPIDFAGNVGAWRYGSTFRLRRYAEYAAAARYVGTWTKVGGAPWYGGTAMKSTQAGAKVRITFTGRSFAWIGLFRPDRGRAAIYVNGMYMATVDLYRASQLGPGVAWAKTWTTTATRTVEIRVLGTPTRPRIDVDGFWTGT